MRFLADIVRHALSTTVSRYQRLHLSRRRGNAVRQSLVSSGVIEAVPIATRSGQVVLYQLTDAGRSVCDAAGLAPGPRLRAGLEHSYWVMKVKGLFEQNGYDVTLEHAVKDNGTIDLLAERPGERVAIEVETGKSDVKANLTKLRGKGFDRIVMVATSPSAVSTCEQAIGSREQDSRLRIELLTWLDVS